MRIKLVYDGAVKLILILDNCCGNQNKKTNNKSSKIHYSSKTTLPKQSVIRLYKCRTKHSKSERKKSICTNSLTLNRLTWFITQYPRSKHNKKRKEKNIKYWWKLLGKGIWKLDRTLPKDMFEECLIWGKTFFINNPNRSANNIHYRFHFIRFGFCCNIQNTVSRLPNWIGRENELIKLYSFATIERPSLPWHNK